MTRLSAPFRARSGSRRIPDIALPDGGTDGHRRRAHQIAMPRGRALVSVTQAGRRHDYAELCSSQHYGNLTPSLTPQESAVANVEGWILGVAGLIQ